MSDDNDQAMTRHPLFARPDGDPEGDRERDYGWIQIRRQEVTGWQTVPAWFPASALVDLATLHASYGGGIYELIAYNSSKSKWVDKARITLPGPSLPIVPIPEEDPAPAAPMLAPVIASPDGGAMAMLGSVMSSMIQLQIASQAEQTKVLVAMLTRPSGDGALVEMIRGMQAQTTELIRAMQAPRATMGESALDAYRSGLREALDHVPQAADDDEPSMMEVLTGVSSMVGSTLAAMKAPAAAAGAAGAAAEVANAALDS